METQTIIILGFWLTVAVVAVYKTIKFKSKVRKEKGINRHNYPKK